MDKVIVLGCPRSGTTFLMKCLNALPYTECLSGILLPVPIAHLAAQRLSSEAQACLDYAFESAFQIFLESGYSSSRFRAVHRLLNGSLSLEEFKQIFQRKRSLKRFIYKEPFLSFAPEYVYRALPDCRIIYIYRDGRDCANSLVRSYDVLSDQKLQSLKTSEASFGYQHGEYYIPWWVEDSKADEFLDSTPYVRAIWMWKEMVKRCEDFFLRPDVLLDRRVLKVRYEDLAQEPAAFGKKIVNFLDAEIDHKLLKRFQSASPRSIGKYKKREPEEIAAAEKLAHRELALYDYI